MAIEDMASRITELKDDDGEYVLLEKKDYDELINVIINNKKIIELYEEIKNDIKNDLEDLKRDNDKNVSINKE